MRIQQSRQWTGSCDPRVVQESRIHLRAASVLRTGEGLPDRGGFLRCQAAFALSELRGDLLRIEMAAEGIEDHSVRRPIERVALLHQCIDHKLAILVRKNLFDLRLTRSVLRSRATRKRLPLELKAFS